MQLIYESRCLCTNEQQNMEFISCLRHPEFNISHLYLKKEKIEILCKNCLEENVIDPETFQIKKLIRIIPAFYQIIQVICQPEILLEKLDLESNIAASLQSLINMNTSFVNEQIKEIEKLIVDMQQHLQQILQQFKNCVKKLEEYRKELLDGIVQGIQIDQFKHIISGLTVQKKNIDPDVIEQIKARLQKYFEQLQNNYVNDIQEVFWNKIEQIQKNVDYKIQSIEILDKLKLKLETLQIKEFKLITSSFPIITKQTQSNLLSNNQQLKIVSIIKQRVKKDIQDLKLIYLGTRDGLTAQQFWSKVNGKANLLMIFKSNSNYMFGGYSPCQWQMEQNGYVEDNSLSSFLFSQNHDEIYPQKKMGNLMLFVVILIMDQYLEEDMISMLQLIFKMDIQIQFLSMGIISKLIFYSFIWLRNSKHCGM